LKEAGAFGGIMAELMAQDAKGAWRVGEAPGDLRARALVNEVGAEGFVLAVEGDFGGEEEPGIGVDS
jgi:hypothetical protein